MAERDTSPIVAAISPQDAPSQTDGSGTTITVANWNIRNGRNGGLEGALRAVKALGVDFGLLTETKLTGGIYTRNSSGYEVLATDAVNAHQGGVAICWRKSADFEVEETRAWGPNVMTSQLVTGRNRFYVVGGYIPPSDLTTLVQIQNLTE